MKKSYLVLFILCCSLSLKAQVIITLDSTVKSLKTTLSNYYISKRIQQHMPFYSPVHVQQMSVSTILVPALEVGIIQQQLQPNQHLKFDMWGKNKVPLYMQPNRYDWMYKARENERH